MDNYDRNSLWADKYPRWTVGDLKRAIYEQCQFCNGTEKWTEENDCSSPTCPLFVFRPGTQREEVEKDGSVFRRAGKSAGRVQSGKAKSKYLPSVSRQKP